MDQEIVYSIDTPVNHAIPIPSALKKKFAPENYGTLP
jgi:hypothetical protein